jgi:hypothetical protein
MDGKRRCINLHKKYFGPIMSVRDVIPYTVGNIKVQKYRMGLQNYTFIRVSIDGIKKVIYIQNLGNEFFSEESVYDIDYIKDLKVECIRNFNQEYNKIRLYSRTFQSKYIRN